MEKSSATDIVIRALRPEDNAAMASVIRSTLKEFGADRPGTVYFDPTTDDLYRLFQEEGSFYQVAVAGDTIVGGGGIFPSARWWVRSF